MNDERFIHFLNGHLEKRLNKQEVKEFLDMIDSDEKKEILAENTVTDYMLRATRKRIMPDQVLALLPKQADTLGDLLKQLSEEVEVSDPENKKLVLDIIKNHKPTVIRERKTVYRQIEQIYKKNIKRIYKRKEVPEFVKRLRMKQASPFMEKLKPYMAIAATCLLVTGVYQVAKHNTLAPTQQASVKQLAMLDASGDVLIRRGSQSIKGGKNTVLLEGDTIITKANSHALIQYLNEASFVKLRSGSSLDLSDNAGAKRLLLKSGSLLASVAKQAEGQPMVVETPHARVTVLGTIFKIRNQADLSELEVVKGRVSAMPWSSGRSVEVPAGQSVDIGNNIKLKVKASKQTILGHLSLAQLQNMEETLQTIKEWEINTLTYIIPDNATSKTLSRAIRILQENDLSIFLRIDMKDLVNAGFESRETAKDNIVECLEQHDFDGVFFCVSPKERNNEQLSSLINEVGTYVRYLMPGTETIAGTYYYENQRSEATWHLGY